ncbi:DNA repair and recombination protein RAD52 [Wickerhamiella sorbophila]|uniref:DNA repair and recombination protein RAD52 n=1 Tax=Wickerhamiella sorbophila TaxID=45607 RepID=A0A2T0FDB3_9ASCO|nr:DNA repair and recombination protein RAD52 [Wickerhamiella sorbophila]PRT52992.1 DNA repair and recombination protein RAD52 [Wickerhamiella sorbophila]
MKGTAQRDKIASELGQGLGPEYISWRRGSGAQQAYIEGHTVINLANEILGFDGWSSEIRNTAVEYEKASSDGRWQIGVRCVMRITLKATGVYREDIGFGQAINMPSKLQALEKAHKEAATDATKRAFRQFGNALGNCIYDRTHTNAITSVNVPKREFDPTCLRRPAPAAPPPPSKRVAVAYKQEMPNEMNKLPRGDASLSTPTPIPKPVLASENDDDDELDFTHLQPAAKQTETDAVPDNQSDDAVFVSANNAEAYNSPKLPIKTHFDPDYRSPSIKTTIPQNFSSKVFRRD